MRGVADVVSQDVRAGHPARLAMAAEVGGIDVPIVRQHLEEVSTILPTRRPAVEQHEGGTVRRSLRVVDGDLARREESFAQRHHHISRVATLAPRQARRIGRLTRSIARLRAGVFPVVVWENG